MRLDEYIEHLAIKAIKEREEAQAMYFLFHGDPTAHPWDNPEPSEATKRALRVLHGKERAPNRSRPKDSMHRMDIDEQGRVTYVPIEDLTSHKNSSS